MKLAATILATLLTVAGSQIAMPQLAKAADVDAISGGAFKQVLTALVAQYEKESGNKADPTFQTVGQHLSLIRGGKEEFDVAVLTPEAIDSLAKEGKVVPGSRADLAKVGVGVVVKAGTPLPDISTVDAFKRALLAARQKCPANVADSAACRPHQPAKCADPCAQTRPGCVRESPL